MSEVKEEAKESRRERREKREKVQTTRFDTDVSGIVRQQFLNNLSVN